MMDEEEGKNRWIILFIIVAILSLIGVSVLTILLHKRFKNQRSILGLFLSALGQFRQVESFRLTDKITGE